MPCLIRLSLISFLRQNKLSKKRQVALSFQTSMGYFLAGDDQPHTHQPDDQPCGQSKLANKLQKPSLSKSVNVVHASVGYPLAEGVCNQHQTERMRIQSAKSRHEASASLYISLRPRPLSLLGLLELYMLSDLQRTERAKPKGPHWHLDFWPALRFNATSRRATRLAASQQACPTCSLIQGSETKHFYLLLIHSHLVVELQEPFITLFPIGA